MKKLKHFLTSETLVFIAILCVMLAQVMHTVYVFEATSRFENAWFSVFYGCAIELAILIFVVNGLVRVSVVFALASFATNLLYYFWPDSDATRILLSAMLAGSIAGFTHLFKRKIANDTQHPYECTQCGERFKTGKQLNGHISAHKRKGDWK